MDGDGDGITGVGSAMLSTLNRVAETTDVVVGSTGSHSPQQSEKYGMVKQRTWGGIKSATKSVPPLHHLLPHCAVHYPTSPNNGVKWRRMEQSRKRKRATEIHSPNEQILCSKKITKNLTGKRITAHCVPNSNPQHIAHLHKQKETKEC